MMKTAKIVATKGSIKVISVALLASIKFKPKPNKRYPKNMGTIAMYKETKVCVWKTPQLLQTYDYAQVWLITTQNDGTANN